MKIIREFLEWRRYTRLYQEIDINSNTKEKLRALGWEHKELINDVLNKTKNAILNKCFSEDVSVEYMRGVKYTLDYIRGLIK